MKKSNFVSFRITDEEQERLEQLAGDMTITNFVANAAFSKQKVRGNANEYPGWEVIETGRRDKGIKIARDPVPLGMESPVMLYPEDREWERFNSM